MMQDTGYKIQDSGCKIQDTGYRITDKKTIMHRASCIMYHQKSHASCIMHHDKKGITLIELVITMVLMGIVALVVANALSTGVKGFFVVDNRKEALDQGRIAMDRMAKEMRNVRNSASATGSAIQFCFTDTSGTQINYSYSGTDIKRDTGNCSAGSGATLSTGINPFVFEYIRSNGNIDAAFSAANTKKIRITFTAIKESESIQLQTEVWPRNL